MYILKGKRRNALVWLVLAGIATVAFVILLNHLAEISARTAFIYINAYFVTSLFAIYLLLRGSDEESWLTSSGLLQYSYARHAIFFYLIYGSVGLYSLVGKRFQPEGLPRFAFAIIILVVVFPDVLLFLRTKLDSGNSIYQRANLFGFWILLLLVMISVGAGIVAAP